MSATNSGIQALSGLFGGGTTGGASGTNLSGSMPNYGSNQYMNYPNMPTPGVVPAQTGLPGSSPVINPSGETGLPGTSNTMGPGHNITIDPTFDPNFTTQLYNMLAQQLGQGMTPFNLSTALPSGGTTSPGQLNAPLNTTLQSIMQFLSGGQTNIPGANQLTQMAQTGDPVDQTAAWKAMIGSEQQNIQQNEADLKEQFAFGGALGGSEFGTAMSNYEQQTTANQNAQLTAATATSQENAMNRMMAAGQGIQGEAQQFGSGLQQLDQNAIQNMLTEFERIQPQNNPLMQMMAALGIAQPATNTSPNAAQNFNSIMSGIGAIL